MALPPLRHNQHLPGMACVIRDGAPNLDTIRYLAARIFPSSRPLSSEYVAEGVSTFVYRIARGAERFYLRMLPEADASFAPEVAAYTLLRARGVSVPEIVYFAHRDAILDRSVMVTTEIPGQPLARLGLDRHTQHVLYRAGQDLAAINSLPVRGFGWIDRDHDRTDQLTAPNQSYWAFVREHLADDLALLAGAPLGATGIAAIEGLIINHDGWLDAEHGSLAHGDFDATHIYAHEGAYSGVIDFGEIRGTDRWYDLGHFRLHDGETLPAPLLPWLLAGYRSVAPLPDNAETRIAFASLLIGIRTLARTWPRHPAGSLVAHCLLAIERDVLSLTRA
jgi:aminoglycoside phosphotransferase (APT) family kinase protein